MTSDLKLKPSDVLAKAADLIEPEGAWTQGESGRDLQGEGHISRDPRNVCWCAMGAIWKQVTSVDPLADTCADYLAKATGWMSGVVDWNDRDERTQAEVVAALRAASTLARGAGE